MKQRILLIVAVLLIAAPALATVYIDVQQDATDKTKVYVTYNCTASEKVRAFALNLDLGSEGNSMVFSAIGDFNVGESNSVKKGYGIFPGQFALQINPSSPDWYAQYYTPIAPVNEVDSNGTGLSTRHLICELGTLYKDSNEPGTSGTLFTVTVDANGLTSDTLTVSANTVRGGIVLEDGTTTSDTNLPVIETIVLGPPCPSGPPATLTYPAVDNNNGRFQITWSSVTNAEGYKLDRSADGGGSWVNIYTGSALSKCDDVNNGSYMYRVCATASGCSDTTYNTGAGSCVVTLCHPADANLANWYSVGKPRCWCYGRQCHGDADGTRQGSAGSGYYWVGSGDLSIFTKSYLVKEPPKGPGLQGEPNLCADYDHNRQGSAGSGYYRVGSNDLSRFTASYLVKEPPKGSGVATCPGTFIDPAWPKPCN